MSRVHPVNRDGEEMRQYLTCLQQPRLPHRRNVVQIHILGAVPAVASTLSAYIIALPRHRNVRWVWHAKVDLSSGSFPTVITVRPKTLRFACHEACSLGVPTRDWHHVLISAQTPKTRPRIFDSCVPLHGLRWASVQRDRSHLLLLFLRYFWLGHLFGGGNDHRR